MSVQHQAALAAFLVKRPVKVKFDRTDSLNYHPCLLYTSRCV